MKERLSILLGVCMSLVVVSASPVVGHHVEVPDSPSDSDALGVFVGELQAQAVMLKETHDRYEAATSGIEKADIADEMRAGIVATSDHMASLDVRGCFAPIVSAFAVYVGALAEAYSVDVAPDERVQYLMRVDAQGAGLGTAVVVSVLACAP